MTTLALCSHLQATELSLPSKARKALVLVKGFLKAAPKQGRSWICVASLSEPDSCSFPVLISSSSADLGVQELNCVCVCVCVLCSRS